MCRGRGYPHSADYHRIVLREDASIFPVLVSFEKVTRHILKRCGSTLTTPFEGDLVDISSRIPKQQGSGNSYHVYLIELEDKV